MLRCRPDVEWMCDACKIRNGLDNIEKLLSIRAIDDQPGDAGKADGEAAYEILVKLEDYAYVHSTWVAEKDIVLAAAAYPGLKAKYRKFKQRVAELGGVDALKEVDEANGLENGINPLWITPERVIACEEDADGLLLS